MTDKEINLIFDSIPNFDEFLSNVKAFKKVELRNNIKIDFPSNFEVAISIDQNNFNLNLEIFNKIINEFLIEKKYQEQEESIFAKKQHYYKIRNEIFKIDNNTFKVHLEYIENMYSSQDIASTHSLYLQNLIKLFRLIKFGNILQIEDVKIKNHIGLIDYLESYGFEFIKQDLTKLDIQN